MQEASLLPDEEQTSKLAKVAFFLSFIPCVGLFAACLGVIALITIATTPKLKGTGIAIMSIFLGLLITGIVLYQGLSILDNSMRNEYGRKIDASNLKQFHQAMDDYHSAYPDAKSMPHLSEMLSKDQSKFLKSPLLRNGYNPPPPLEKPNHADIYKFGDYIFCYGDQLITTLPADTVIAFTRDTGGGRNVLFANGDVKWFEEADFVKLSNSIDQERAKQNLEPYLLYSD